ncbi:MAG: hypothetical protein COV66_10680 [Nitrospinae bacterium CG11_big_fil_rev_8_21_14_0_20_45_15]|nr:MAG: hypothetical protein COV66_10680 [Nitrospinae bacterium CG11_big_fil_rev_8_21_14_0_20_45_15]
MNTSSDTTPHSEPIINLTQATSASLSDDVTPNEILIARKRELILFNGFFYGVLFFLYTLCGLLYVNKGNSIAWNGITEEGEWILYACLFSLFPIIAVIISHLADRKDPENLSSFSTTMFVWNGSVVSGLMIYLSGYPLLKAAGLEIFRIPSMGLFMLTGIHPEELQITCLIHFFGLFLLGNNRIGSFVRWTFPYLRIPILTLVPLLFCSFFIIYSPYAPHSYPINYILEVLKHETFFIFLKIGGAITVGCLIFAVFENQLLKSKPKLHLYMGRVSLGVALTFCLLLFDFNLVGDARHYSAVLGPALHLKNGGIPMVDVFSIYGFLPYVIMYWAVDIFTMTYSTGALVVRYFNVALFMVIVILIYRLCSKRFTACLMILPMLLLYLMMADGDNLAKFPSASGLRYLIPVSLALAFSFLPIGKKHNFWTLGLLTLSSFWSVETFGMTLCTYLFFIVAAGVLQKQIFSTLGHLLLLPLTIGAAHLAYAGYMLIRYDTLPRFDVYLQIFASSRPTVTDGTTFWSMAIPVNLWLWAINAVVYFMLIVYILHQALETKSNNLTEENWRLVNRVLPTVAVGIFMLIYFVGRSHPSGLVMAELPLFVAGLTTLDLLFSKSLKSCISKWSFLVVFLIAFPLLTAIGLHRFTPPLSTHSGNSTILRQCYMPSGCQPQSIYKHISETLKKKMYLHPGSHPDALLLAILKDTHQMIELLQPNQDKILLLNSYGMHGFPYTTTSLMYANKGHRLPISNTIEDELAPKVYNKIFAALDGLQENEILITLKDSMPLFRFEQSILDKIKEKWTLCPLLHSKNGVVAYRLSKSNECKNLNIVP